jgi:cytosine/uracil/thiamine/allantoin permease
MHRFKFSYLGLAVGLLGLAGSSLATDLTSDNNANVVAWIYGGASTYSAWSAALSASPTDDFTPASSSCNNPTIGCASALPGGFAITGTNGVSSSIFTSTSYPLTITLPATLAVTGLELELSGLLSLTLTLSDGSSVTTNATNYTPSSFVTFLSPLPIVTTTIYSETSGSIADLSWGSANPADLPSQPVDGDPAPPSDTPEAATLLLMGGGLLLMSRWRKRNALCL